MSMPKEVEDRLEICTAWWEDGLPHLHDCELPVGHDGDHLCNCGIRCKAGDEYGD